jgi:hypothetical protein
MVAKYFEVVENPQDADFALVGIQSPNGGVGYDGTDLANGGNGYNIIVAGNSIGSITLAFKIISSESW